MDTVAMVAREDPEKGMVIDTLASPLAKSADLLVEALWNDAVTGEVLGATVDHHFGQAAFDGPSFGSWAEVNRYLEAYADRKSTRLNSSHQCATRMPYSARKKNNTQTTHTNSRH